MATVIRRVSTPAADAFTFASRAIHRFVSRHVREPADAADIAQQALLQAWSDRSRSQVENPRTLLLTIGRRLIIHHYRVRGRFKYVDAEDTLAESEPSLQWSAEGVSNATEGRRALRTLMSDIVALPALEHQVALLLADVHQRRDKDSATTLRLSISSFKLLLSGARAALRRARRTGPGAETATAPVEGSPAREAAPREKKRQRLGVRMFLSRQEQLALRRELLHKALR